MGKWYGNQVDCPLIQAMIRTAQQRCTVLADGVARAAHW